GPDHPRDQQVQEAAIVARDRAVDDVADQERRDQSEERGRENARQNEDRGPPRGEEVAGDPREIRARRLQILWSLSVVEVEGAHGRGLVSATNLRFARTRITDY